jgi:hypothetical protein
MWIFCHVILNVDRGVSEACVIHPWREGGTWCVFKCKSKNKKEKVRPFSDLYFL